MKKYPLEVNLESPEISIKKEVCLSFTYDGSDKRLKQCLTAFYSSYYIRSLLCQKLTDISRP